jgi:transposase
MHSAKTRESRRGEGVRQTTARPTNESPVEAASPHPAGSILPNPEVVARPTRRRFTAEDKLRIMKLTAACTAVGSLGALLRTEGLYASNLTTWRRQHTEGVRSALTPQKRGQIVSAQYPLRTENETLRKENAGLSTRLKQAELIIDVQKQFPRSWTSRCRCSRKASAPDGRHTVTVQGDRHSASL